MLSFNRRIRMWSTFRSITLSSFTGTPLDFGRDSTHGGVLAGHIYRSVLDLVLDPFSDSVGDGTVGDSTGAIADYFMVAARTASTAVHFTIETPTCMETIEATRHMDAATVALVVLLAADITRGVSAVSREAVPAAVLADALTAELTPVRLEDIATGELPEVTLHEDSPVSVVAAISAVEDTPGAATAAEEGANRQQSNPHSKQCATRKGRHYEN